MTGLIIREATEADAAKLKTYRWQLAGEPSLTVQDIFDTTTQREHDWIRQHNEQDNALLLVAEVDGEIVGVLNGIGGRDTFTRHSVSLNLSIRRDDDRPDIMTHLIDRALIWARSKGYIKRIQLEVFAGNEAALRLFERKGFSVEGFRDNAYYINHHYADTYLLARQIA